MRRPEVAERGLAVRVRRFGPARVDRAGDREAHRHIGHGIARQIRYGRRHTVLRSDWILCGGRGQRELRRSRTRGTTETASGGLYLNGGDVIGVLELAHPHDLLGREGDGVTLHILGPLTQGEDINERLGNLVDADDAVAAVGSQVQEFAANRDTTVPTTGEVGANGPDVEVLDF